VTEPDPTPPPASESAEWEAERAAQRRRLLLISIAAGGIALVVIIGLLIARPWEDGTPAATPTPTDGITSASPSDEPSDSPTSPAPSQSGSPQPEPVPIESPGTIVSGLTAQVIGIEAVDGVAKGPGEVSGPSIRFTVTITNSTSSAVDLTATVVTVDYGADRTPAGQLYEPGASPMPTTVAAGSSASGVYVFSIPTDQRSLVNITVDYSVGVPPLVFSGPVP